MNDSLLKPPHHHVVIGLGGNGFGAVCTCGWYSHTSWKRTEIATVVEKHKRQSKEVP